jgi:hypothetical protein
MELEKEEAFYSNATPSSPATSNHTKVFNTKAINDTESYVDIFNGAEAAIWCVEAVIYMLMDMAQHSVQREQIEMLKVRKQTSGKTYNDIRKKIATISKWVSAYGMSDDDEMWATAVEKFFDLPREHRSKILKLMMS